MKPLDPRLLRHARAARRYIVLTALMGAVTAGLVIAQAVFIARAVAPVAEGEAAWADVAPHVGIVAGIVVARFVALVIQEAYAHRAATDVVAELRAQVLERAVRLGPRWLADGHGPEVATLATRGLDDLEPYFVRYLPQLVLAATVTPAALAVVFGLDLVAAVTIALTLPLIPVFMWLIGVLTQRFAAKKLQLMERLGAQLLDLLAGLGTLKALGREHGPGRRVADLGRAYTRTTMATLKVAFLSGAVLEFLTTLSVALVAVGVGMRLVYGQVDLVTGLAVIMLAPEVYRPIREVGSQFHASSDGIAAAEHAFAVLEAPLTETGSAQAPSLRGARIELDGVSVAAPGRATVAPAGLSGQIAPGAVTALVGPSGAGKTTTALIVLGLLRPDEGRVLVHPAGGSAIDLADVDPASWWRQVTWVPQRPTLVPGTVRENLLGSPDAEITEAVREAARMAGFADVVAETGWDADLGQGGVGLSVGQRQRLALTRALLGGEPLVVLDEPTAHLDARTERDVLAVVDHLRDHGRTVLVIAHRPSLVARADAVIDVASAPAAAADTALQRQELAP